MDGKRELRIDRRMVGKIERSMRTVEQTTCALSPANLPITPNKDTTGKDWGITLAIKATKQNKRYVFFVFMPIRLNETLLHLISPISAWFVIQGWALASMSWDNKERFQKFAGKTIKRLTRLNLAIIGTPCSPISR